jgi:signal transduction histidine kinase
MNYLATEETTMDDTSRIDTSRIATIMVVDDVPGNLKLLQDMLQANSYRVLAFPNGRLALSAAARNRPDLMLLDINMPEMNGYEVCERLKADPALQEIPVLFISALGETADKVKAFSVGGVDYVTKPFQFDEVHARVRTHLELCRQRRQLLEANARLRELEQLRDNLTHMIVHDMRSPLAVLGGAITLLCDELPADAAELLRLCQMGKKAAGELTEMCNGLLDVSRLEAGEMPVEREACELSAVVSDAVHATKIQADAASVTVCAEVSPVRIPADKKLLQRILANLLTNAIKNTPEGGRITVRAQVIPDGIRVEVADTGCGIPPEYHQRIFEKFGQVAARREAKHHSTGLGLPFCKLAVEAHGGTIGVASEVGRGSVFWFILPDRPEDVS